MMGSVIYLIEDKLDVKEDTLSLLREKTPPNLQNKISFKWLPGEEQENDDHKYYTENVLQNIADKKAEVEAGGGKMGLLLDILLTEEEDKSAGKTYYPNVQLAKKIYHKYKNDMPIYIVTVLNSFGAQCDVIMGEDLSDRYVTKSALLEYKMENSIKALFDFYNNEFEKKDKEYVCVDCG